MKILITGGRGYVGSSLGSYLLNKGNDIILASRGEDNTIADTLGLHSVQVSWDDLGSLDKICSGIDVIIHAAGMNKQDCADTPFAALMFNGVVTANLVNAAVKNGVSKFIYLSSYHLYSRLLQGEIKESDCPCNPHPYAVSHRVGEDAVLAAAQQDLINGVVLRMSNGFGAPVRPEVDCWHLFVNELCRKAVETQKLLIRSNGREQRNFIPVNEICSIISFLLSRSENLPTGHNLLNVGTAKNMSLSEMAYLIRDRCIQVLGYEPAIINDKVNSGSSLTDFSFQLDRLFDLGYTTKFTISNEVDALLSYCQKNFARG